MMVFQKKYSIVFYLIASIPFTMVGQGDYVGAGQYIKNILPMRERVQNMELWWKWKRQNVLPDIIEYSLINPEHSEHFLIIVGPGIILVFLSLQFTQRNQFEY